MCEKKKVVDSHRDEIHPDTADWAGSPRADPNGTVLPPAICTGEPVQKRTRHGFPAPRPSLSHAGGRKFTPQARLESVQKRAAQF